MSNLKKIHIVKRIAIVAYDNNRTDLIEWSYLNKNILSKHEIVAAGATAELLEGTLGIPVSALACGTLGGYRQLARLISKGNIDIIIFFGDSRTTAPQDSSIKELLPLAAEQHIMIACNIITADMIIESLRENKADKSSPVEYFMIPPQHTILTSINNYLRKAVVAFL